MKSFCRLLKCHCIYGNLVLLSEIPKQSFVIGSSNIFRGIIRHSLLRKNGFYFCCVLIHHSVDHRCLTHILRNISCKYNFWVTSVKQRPHIRYPFIKAHINSHIDFSFQIIAFDELKTDYKNPIDQCGSLNPLVLPEYIMHILFNVLFLMAGMVLGETAG